MTQDKILNLKRVSQYGDIFMLDFECDACGENNFKETYGDCDHCLKEFNEYQLDFTNVTRRLVTGTSRKYRFSKKLIAKLKKEQEAKCAYCFCCIVTEYHIEHIKPLCVGGTNNLHNLVLSCPTCNFIAGGFVFYDFFAKQRYVLDRRKKKKKYIENSN